MTAKKTLKKASRQFFLPLSIFIILVLMIRTGIFSSPDRMEAFLDKAGMWAPAAFVLLQIIQIIIPVIPGGLSCVIGVLVFGSLFGFLYNFAGMLIGSALAFWIGKKCGKTFILKFVSQSKYQKYEYGSKKGKNSIFSLRSPSSFRAHRMILTRDLVCMTLMSFKKFLTLYALCKPLSLLTYSIGFELSQQDLPGSHKCRNKQNSSSDVIFQSINIVCSSDHHKWFNHI